MIRARLNNLYEVGGTAEDIHSEKDRGRRASRLETHGIICLSLVRRRGDDPPGSAFFLRGQLTPEGSFLQQRQRVRHGRLPENLVPPAG